MVHGQYGHYVGLEQRRILPLSIQSIHAMGLSLKKKDPADGSLRQPGSVISDLKAVRVGYGEDAASETEWLCPSYKDSFLRSP